MNSRQWEMGLGLEVRREKRLVFDPHKPDAWCFGHRVLRKV